MFAHLVPTGTPGALMSFIVLIELIRRVIRPITLSVRLAANIIAGHLLLTLVSSAISLSPLLILIILGVISLAVLESAVAIIQAYVFSILSVLYVEEVTSIKLN
jgi:F-type H+-transporting ATPase subunit a